MAAFAPQVFPNIDAPKWQRIKALILKEIGITVNSDAGQDSKDGVTLSWSYTNQTLTTTLVKREFFDPSAAEIEGDITKLVAQA